MRVLFVGLALLVAGCTAPETVQQQEAVPRPAVELGPWQGPEQPLLELVAVAPPNATPPDTEPEPTPSNETTPPQAPPAAPTPPPPPPPAPAPEPAAPAPAPAPQAAPTLAVQFEPGADAAPSTIVRRLVVSADGGSFDASIAGVDDATVRIGSLVRLVNVDGTSHIVRLAAARVDDPRVVAARFQAGGGELDLRAAAPLLEVTLAPGARLDVAFELTLAGASVGDTLFVSRVETSLQDR